MTGLEIFQITPMGSVKGVPSDQSTETSSGKDSLPFSELLSLTDGSPLAASSVIEIPAENSMPDAIPSANGSGTVSPTTPSQISPIVLLSDTRIGVGTDVLTMSPAVSLSRIQNDGSTEGPWSALQDRSVFTVDPRANGRSVAPTTAVQGAGRTANFGNVASSSLSNVESSIETAEAIRGSGNLGPNESASDRTSLPGFGKNLSPIAQKQMSPLAPNPMASGNTTVVSAALEMSMPQHGQETARLDARSAVGLTILHPEGHDNSKGELRYETSFPKPVSRSSSTGTHAATGPHSSLTTVQNDIRDKISEVASSAFKGNFGAPHNETENRGSMHVSPVSTLGLGKTASEALVSQVVGQDGPQAFEGASVAFRLGEPRNSAIQRAFASPVRSVDEAAEGTTRNTRVNAPDLKVSPAVNVSSSDQNSARRVISLSARSAEFSLEAIEPRTIPPASPFQQLETRTTLAPSLMEAPSKPSDVKPFAEALISQVRSVQILEGRTTVNLHPRGLGAIEIEVFSEHDLASKVVVRVENPAVLNALREERHLLAHSIGVADSSVLSFDTGERNEKHAERQDTRAEIHTSAQTDEAVVLSEPNRELIGPDALDITT